MSNAPIELARGAIVWVSFDPARGREQAGHRPALVISSNRYLAVVETLAIVLPITTVDRGWPNHVRVEGPSGLHSPSWAMTEQPRSLARERISRLGGFASTSTMTNVDTYLRDFLDL